MAAGVVLIKRMTLLTNTTPASAFIYARLIGLALRGLGFPSSAEEVELSHQSDFMCKADALDGCQSAVHRCGMSRACRLTHFLIFQRWNDGYRID
jgi:hypothetical protein